jgi:hypothetical protein
VRNALPALKDDEDLRAALLGRERGNRWDRKADGRGSEGGRAIASEIYFLAFGPHRWLETRDKKLLSKLADFQLLIYLSKYVNLPPSRPAVPLPLLASLLFITFFFLTVLTRFPNLIGVLPLCAQDGALVCTSNAMYSPHPFRC